MQGEPAIRRAWLRDQLVAATRAVLADNNFTDAGSTVSSLAEDVTDRLLTEFGAAEVLALLDDPAALSAHVTAAADTLNRKPRTATGGAGTSASCVTGGVVGGGAQLWDGDALRATFAPPGSGDGSSSSSTSAASAWPATDPTNRKPAAAVTPDVPGLVLTLDEVGEPLYAFVSATAAVNGHRGRAGKITGMLLDGYSLQALHRLLQREQQVPGSSELLSLVEEARQVLMVAGTWGQLELEPSCGAQKS